MEQTSPVVLLQAVQKAFPLDQRHDLQVLDISHLAIPAGSYSVIRGPSGSGKTTLLNLIAGITIPTSGHIQVHGSDITIFIALLGGLAGLVGGHGMAVLGAHLLAQRGGLALTPFTISAL